MAARSRHAWLAAAALCGAVCTGMSKGALAQPAAFSFGSIAHTGAHSADDAALREAIDATDADSLAFVVVNGIKAASEPCTDPVYLRRKALFGSAKNGLLVSVASSDWSECTRGDGRSVAVERLNRVRDLFFADDFSFGASRLPVTRQATMPKYRAYAENMRWDIGNIVFATVHLPANNNDFVPAAGRNAEFEDRMIADRDWLHRVFRIALQKQAAGIVLFCDGNPLTLPDVSSRPGIGPARDGFAEIRKQILALSARYSGRILIVLNGAPATTPVAGLITWQGNVGITGASAGWLKLTVDAATPALFSVSRPPTGLKTAGQ